ncbi:uncharacterized protein LOC117896667 [Drosophila subobscura]|uniref:uncharacterized protein LOC117896667 n=1 Tax=Drosophila subobscura TaxID=7241 RepID=UPI00155B39E2|nr:uncharacterized protein LOC117896667 [Drosophila subobscura]
MFPNYCFTKSTQQLGFDIHKRQNIPKDLYTRNGRPSELVAKFNRNLTPQLGVRYVDVAGPGYLGSSNGKRSKRKLPKSSSIKNTAQKPPSALKPTVFRRNVAFRLPAVVCVSKESMAEPTKHEREPAGDDKVRERRRDRQEAVIDNPNRELQESFADFFSIMHDNVLETVQGAVSEMVAKCFEEPIAKVERLSSEMMHQEKMLNKMFRDINAKMDDQNETSLNQFKFVTQMLIDNQTVHYRALNQAKLEKRRLRAERESEKERERERKKERSTGGTDNEKESNKRTLQHQLWQQQNPHVDHTEMCMACTQEEFLARQHSPPSRTPSRPPSVPRLPPRIPAVSMPDLSKRALSGLGTNNRSVQPDVQSLKPRISRQRSVCQKATTNRPVLPYPPSVHSELSSRRCCKRGSSAEYLQ